MNHPKVNNLRYYENIGYYSVFDNLNINDFNEGKNLGKGYDSLEGKWRFEFLAISTIE